MTTNEVETMVRECCVRVQKGIRAEFLPIGWLNGAEMLLDEILAALKEKE